jgi:glycoprotein endo-alpha-1,2-mannosidase
MRLLLALILVVLAVPAGAAAAPKQVSIFFYPWWGTPSHDDDWLHWHQRGARPPVGIASAFFPARGVYSSGDRAVLRSQMGEIARAGVDQVVTSWWGRGSVEDLRLPSVLKAAKARGLSVAAHIEDYPWQTVASTEQDIEYLRGFGITDFYVFGSMSHADGDWAAMNARLDGVRVFAHTGQVGRALRGGFDGIYTYDLLIWGPASFARLCAQAHKVGLLCAPSVGPGFDARRATGIAKVLPRRAGRTYDVMWRNAIAADADIVSITSYNEWHEGTQIEPARVASGYSSYAGAWGLKGRAAAVAYLRRTALWSFHFRGFAYTASR